MASLEQVDIAAQKLREAGLDPEAYNLRAMPMSDCGQLISNLLAGRDPNYGIIQKEYSSKGEREFDLEISWIINPNVKDLLLAILKEVPDYFYDVEASSTGKYHPKFSLGRGGLIRHTRCVVHLVHELCGHPMCELDATTKDLLVAAAILHDSVKHGVPQEKYTRGDHPLLVRPLLSKLGEKFSTPEFDELKAALLGLVESHMGPWNKGYRGSKDLMPLPTTEAQMLLHNADYIASRKSWDLFY